MEQLENLENQDFELIIEKLTTFGLELGKNIILAVLIFYVGRWLIRFVNRMLGKFMERRNVDPAVRSFFGSIVNVVLLILLFIVVVGTLGIQTTSFAALIASAGVGIGMAMSGSLQNFAGGIMILVFKPYRVGDFVETQNYMGIVKEIQIINTILTTVDNKVVFIPNASITNGVLINYSHQKVRRVDLSFGVEYGTDYAKVKQVIEKLIAEDSRILKDPEHFIGLGQLADSSVDITVRVRTSLDDYWPVSFDFKEKVYKTFNEVGIGFPFPQLTVHQGK